MKWFIVQCTYFLIVFNLITYCNTGTGDIKANDTRLRNFGTLSENKPVTIVVG